MQTISSVPATIEWKVYKGDTSRPTIILEDDNGVAIDTEGFVYFGQIREEADAVDALQDLTITSVDNLITVDIDDSSSLPSLSYFDIQITKEDDTVITILKGQIYAEDDVSR